MILMFVVFELVVPPERISVGLDPKTLDSSDR